MTENGSASTDLVLRCFAPQVVAEAYRRAQSGIGDSRDKLGWRLGLADVVQRYLAAILVADHIGLGLPPPPEYSKLLNKLKTPSLGDWARAMNALAKGILESDDEAVAPEVAGILLEKDDSGDLVSTPVARHLRMMVDLRNKLFHKSASLIPDEAASARHLTTIESPLREVCRALRLLKTLPLLYVQRSDPRRDWKKNVVVLRFTGVDPIRVRLDDALRLEIPPHVPFVMSAKGHALMLPPFVVVGRNEATGLLESRLLYGWSEDRGVFEYSDLGGGECGFPAEEEQPLLSRPDDLRKPEANLFVVRNAAGPDLLPQLVDPGGAGEFPDVPGYKLEGLLGVGASSRVYRAKQILERRPPGPSIALKVLRPEVALDPGQRQRFRSEHEILGTLRHPGIVQTYSYEPERIPHLAMEYVQGEDLQSRVERKPLSPDVAGRIVCEILGALETAHGAGVIHRDIKPSNVLVDRSGSVRLIDFGIAVCERFARMTRTLDGLGTTAFAAPEQLEGTAPAEATADIFSVGRVFEFLVAGSVGRIGTISPKLPEGVHAVVRQATQTEPVYRHQSAAIMRSVIEERMQGAWKGAPVQQGDRLNDSYELHELEGESDGVWCFDGAEIETDDPVSIALAKRESEAGQALSRSVRVAHERMRARAGLRGVQRSSDGLLFCVMAPGGALRKLEILRNPDAEEEEEPRPPDEAGEAHPKDYLAPIRAAIEALEPPGTEAAARSMVMDLAILAGDVQLVIIAQIAAVRRSDPPATLWREWTQSSLGTLVRRFDYELYEAEAWLAQAEDPRFRQMFGVARQRLGALVALRNVVAHAGAAPGVSVEVVTSALEVVRTMYSLAEWLRAEATPQLLAPRLARVAEVAWCLLELRGSKVAYVSLGLDRRSFPPSTDAIEWVSKSGIRSTTKGVRSRIEETEVDVALRVRDEASSWSGVGDVRAEVRAKSPAGRLIAADLVAYDPKGRPLAVIEVKRALEPRHMPAYREQVWIYGRALETPFVALTDGERWNWYVADSENGLSEIEDGNPLV